MSSRWILDRVVNTWRHSTAGQSAGDVVVSALMVLLEDGPLVVATHWESVLSIDKPENPSNIASAKRNNGR